MKRGAKICVLALVTAFASGLMALLLMHMGLISVTSVAMDGPPHRIARNLRGKDDTPTDDTAIPTLGIISQRVAGRTLSVPVDCGGVDRSFAPQCVGVSEKSWKIHRTVQAVGRIVVDNTYCSGVLLGNITNSYFLTAANCLVLSEGTIAQAQVEFINCIGSQIFFDNVVFHLNRELNFVVLRLTTRGFNVASHFGFLRLRVSGPTHEEVVFVPHFTESYNQRITIMNDEGELLRIQQPSTTRDVCSTATTPSSQVQYKAASVDEATVGSPIVSLSDYSVVALHLCGGCKTGGVNTALSTKSIVDDLNAAGHLLQTFLAQP